MRILGWVSILVILSGLLLNSTLTTKADELVAYWKVDEASGNKAYDSSGLGNHGIITGSARTIGKIRNALYFDGRDDYVHVSHADSLCLAEECTPMAWFKITPGCNYYIYDFRHVLSKGAVYERLWADYALGLSNPDDPRGKSKSPPGGLQWESSNPNNNRPDRMPGSPAISQGKWHHVAITFNRAQVCFYVDGTVQEKASVQYAKLRLSKLPLYIGCRYAGPLKGPFSGLIDEIKIYNYARTDEQIARDTQAPDITISYEAKPQESLSGDVIFRANHKDSGPLSNVTVNLHCRGKDWHEITDEKGEAKFAQFHGNYIKWYATYEGKRIDEGKMTCPWAPRIKIGGTEYAFYEDNLKDYLNEGEIYYIGIYSSKANPSESILRYNVPSYSKPRYQRVNYIPISIVKVSNQQPVVHLLMDENGRFEVDENKIKALFAYMQNVTRIEFDKMADLHEGLAQEARKRKDSLKMLGFGLKDWSIALTIVNDAFAAYLSIQSGDIWGGIGAVLSASNTATLIAKIYQVEHPENDFEKELNMTTWTKNAVDLVASGKGIYDALKQIKQAREYPKMLQVGHRYTKVAGSFGLNHLNKEIRSTRNGALVAILSATGKMDVVAEKAALFEIKNMELYTLHKTLAQIYRNLKDGINSEEEAKNCLWLRFYESMCRQKEADLLADLLSVYREMRNKTSLSGYAHKFLSFAELSEKADESEVEKCIKDIETDAKKLYDAFIDKYLMVALQTKKTIGRLDEVKNRN